MRHDSCLHSHLQDKAKEMNTPLIVVVAHDRIRSKNEVPDVIYQRSLHLSDNTTVLLPGFFSLVPNITCELGLSNGTQGIVRELAYDDKDNSVTFNMNNAIFSSNSIYVCKALYTLVKMNSSKVETNLDGLQPKQIPISLIKKEFPYFYQTATWSTSRPESREKSA